ncbi:MAG TPA: cytidylate kinase-like family protein [Prolixibacteraceae bacterium]|nr:cytidylate kinase-like family protein [Prolixibacteraceae bacterium]
MNNTLMVYLNKRLHQSTGRYQAPEHPPGPVICISREVGCGGVNIARLLAVELDKLGTCKRWKVLSKEILEESAHELNMDPNKLKHYLKEGDRGMFDDILSAFSEKRYKSDRKITNTLIDLILSFANDGHCIIVGRAGHIITRNIEKSLFIKLSAPLNWRTKKIMEKFDLNIREATDFIEKTEKERENLMRHIGGENYKDYGFDLTINLSRLNITEVIGLIKYIAQAKGLLEQNISKVEVF